MERTTFSVLFFIRRTRLNKHGQAPVELRITINGTRIDYAVKRTVPPDLWSVAKGKALPKTAECRELNAYLDTIKLRLITLQREMELDGLEVTPKSLLDKYLGVDTAPRRTIMDVFKAHNEKCAKISEEKLRVVLRFFRLDIEAKKAHALSRFTLRYVHDFYLFMLHCPTTTYRGGNLLKLS